MLARKTPVTATHGAATADLATTVARRREAILQQRASNLIEGLDSGPEWVAGLLERAGEPISDKAFSDREAARLVAEFMEPARPGDA